MAVTSSHILTASEDSNINVWSIARLLEFGADPGLEPDVTLSNHRAAITSLVVSPGENPDTNLCVSTSKDKTCILWNYQTGQVLRTLLFPSIPLCAILDPAARALFVSTEDGSIFLVELFGDKPLIGARSTELSSLVVQIDSPLGVADSDAGPAACLALNYDGTTLVSGHSKGKVLRWSLADKSHPTELANLNAAVTNLAFIPLLGTSEKHQVVNVVKPNTTQRQYTITKQLGGNETSTSRFDSMMNGRGFPDSVLQAAATELLDTGTASE